MSSERLMPPVSRAPTSWPPWKNSTVGEPFTPSVSASARFCWRKTFTNFTSPPYCAASASYLGASASQGGHSVE